MMNKILIVICGLLCGAALSSPAQSFPPLFFVAVTNIIDCDRVLPSNNPGDGTALLPLRLAGRDKLEMDELLKDGVPTDRLVRIMDGPRLIAEGRLAGRVQSFPSGILLRFVSAAAADRAVRSIQESPNFDLFDRRKLNDRRSWSLRAEAPRAVAN